MLSPQSAHSLLDTQPITQEGARLQTVLEDIVQNVIIQDDFSIRHLHRSALELPEGLFNGLQQLSIQQQDHYLRSRFSAYLHDLYDDGELKTAPLNQGSIPALAEAPLQNKTVGYGSEFFHHLHHCNSGQGYFDPGWVVLRESADELLVVQKDGLTMHVSRERHLLDPTVVFGDEVSVKLPNSCIEAGCYVAVGNHGPCLKNDTAQSINLYFYLSLDGVLEAVKTLTTALNALNLSFTFSIPYDLESRKDRCGTCILNIDRQAYSTVLPCLKHFYQSNTAHFQPRVPLFAKILAPGIGLLEQPVYAFIVQESFSGSRFQILSEGLINAWRQHLTASEARKNSIVQMFSKHQINLNFPYLRPEYEDDYQLIEG